MVLSATTANYVDATPLLNNSQFFPSRPNLIYFIYMKTL